jgi:hypothetical protein
VPTLSGSAPLLIQRVALSSTTDWVAYTLPSWAGQVQVGNPHASADLYLGNTDESGAFVSATDNYKTIAAGGAQTIPLISKKTAPFVLTLLLASGTASHPVELIIVEDVS